MSKSINTNSNPPHASRSPRTLEDGVTLWRARDVYRVRRGIEGLVLFFLFLEGLSFIGQGRWDLLLTIMGFQVAVLWGGRWLLRQAWARGRWHGLVLIALLGMTLSGCEPMERGVAKMYGIKVDPLPGPCAPESFQARQCLAIQHEGKKP